MPLPLALRHVEAQCSRDSVELPKIGPEYPVMDMTDKTAISYNLLSFWHLLYFLKQEVMPEILLHYELGL